MPITAAQLIAAAPLKSEPVLIPGLESLGALTIREFRFSEQLEYSKIGKESSVAGAAYAISLCVAEFDELSPDDIDAMDTNVVSAITTKIFRLSGLLPDAVDDEEGNS